MGRVVCTVNLVLFAIAVMVEVVVLDPRNISSPTDNSVSNRVLSPCTVVPSTPEAAVVPDIPL